MSDVRAAAGNNSVTLMWSPPGNASSVEITDYFVQIASGGRVIRVDAADTQALVSGLRNGIEETFTIHAATEHGRSEASASVTATPTSGMEGEVAGLIVKFARSSSVTDGQSDVPGEDKVSSVGLTVDTKIADDVHLIELSESVSTEQANQVAAELQSDPGVEWAEPDVFVFPSSVHSDPEYESSQWNLWDEWGLGLSRTDGRDPMSVDPQAGADVTVAVIDTGITSHPDLDSQLVPGYDFVSDPANLAAPRVEGGSDVGFDADGQPGRDADPTDPGDWRGVTPTRNSTWHGTQVAGVIAAQASNSKGIVGVAPGAKIQPIRALSWRGGLMSDIISSITWASGGNVDGAPANANPADIITMSFAAQAHCSVAMQSAIDGASERGSVLVAAAGNANGDVAGYAPANCRDVIAVAATGRDGKRAAYSNYGSGIDIAAPGGALTGGGGVLSTSNTGTQSPDAASYRSSEGTSIAAAHVAGAIARVKSSESKISTSELRSRFLSGEHVRAFPNDQCDADPNINCGSGLLTMAQVASLPAGVTITGGPQYTITVDCSVISGKPTVYIAHHPGERLFTPSYMLCGSFLQVDKYNAEVGNGGVLLGFNGNPSEILPNSIFSGTSITIVYYRALRSNQGARALRPTTQTISALAGSPITVSKAITADDFTGVPTYSISPPLPNGLAIDPVTGVISGTPTSRQTTTTYTITGTYGTETATTSTSITVNQYRVGFDRGGATSGPTDMFVVNSGDQINLPSISRSSYSFNGWYTAATGGTRVGGIGDTYAVTESVTLYAQWTAPYTISTTNTQGGSGGRTDYVAPGSSLTLPSSTKSDATLAGWYDAPSGGNRVGGANESFTPASSMTLYAQWNATVSYNLGPGQLPNGEPSPRIVNYNTTPTITLPTPTGAGYRFDGWFSSSSGGTKLGIGGGSLTVTGNRTIYARWTEQKRIDFDPLGGVNSDNRCQFLSGQCRIWWTPGDPALVLPNLTSNSGLIFDGWYTSSTGGTRRGGGGSTLSNPITETLRAQWTGVKTLDGNGGTLASPTVSAKSGTNFKVPVPYRPGYAFEGWFTSATGGSLRTDRGQNTLGMSSSETWHAQWSQYQAAPTLESAELTSNRKKITLEFTGSVQALYGATLLCEDFVLSSTHSSFNSASKVCSVNGTTVTIESTTALLDSSTSLKIRYAGRSLAAGNDPAQFVHQTSDVSVGGAGVDVVYEGNRGAPSRGPDRVAPGRPVTLPSASRANLTFAGWYDQNRGGTRVGGSGDSFNPANNRTLHAQWLARITFDSDGLVTLPSDADINIDSDPPIVLPSVSRPNYTFQGWYSDAVGGTLIGRQGDAYTPTENVRLHARWSFITAAPPGGGPTLPVASAPGTPALDRRPPRIELEIPARPTPARPAAVVIDGEEVELVVERDEDNTELDVTGDEFSLTVATSDTERVRIAPTSRRSLVAPVRGFVEVSAAGYAPQSTVALYLVPMLSGRMSVRNATELYFLGEVTVDESQAFDNDFRLPDWALAGEYSLQINGYTPEGALKSINVRLDLIDRRADAVSAARACVFPEDSVKLTTECRQSLRSLKQVLPESVDTLTIDITGVAYAQGNKKLNRAVALERAERVQRFLERNDIAGDVTVDVVTRKELAPGLTLGPPPVVVGDSGKPASTVVMTVEWTTEVGLERLVD